MKYRKKIELTDFDAFKFINEAFRIYSFCILELIFVNFINWQF